MSIAAICLMWNNPGINLEVPGVEGWLWDFISHLLKFCLGPSDLSASESYKGPIQPLLGFEELQFSMSIPLGAGD